jgi:predicted ATPase
VQLFIERAQAVKPDFEVTNENAPAVAEICFRLDNLPLAIELATARINLFSPQALFERIGSGTKMLPNASLTRGPLTWTARSARCRQANERLVI